MFRRKKKKETGPDLTREEMEELVDENILFARRHAEAGSVSGMEMSLEIALQYAQKIGRSFDSQDIGRIRLKAYERGEEVLRERAEKLQQEGKKSEAQKALALAATYGNEAKMLRYTLS